MLAGVCDGCFGNRIYTKYNVATNDLINMGAPPGQIDSRQFRVCRPPMRVRALLKKTGAGWYRYEAANPRIPLHDPLVHEMITVWRESRSYAVRDISEEEILRHCIGALAEEGVRLLSEGIAQRVSDIDVVYVNGYGFPRESGGLCFMRR